MFLFFITFSLGQERATMEIRRSDISRAEAKIWKVKGKERRKKIEMGRKEGRRTAY